MSCVYMFVGIIHTCLANLFRYQMYMYILMQFSAVEMHCKLYIATVVAADTNVSIYYY